MARTTARTNITNDALPYAVYCRLSRKKALRQGRSRRREVDETVERQQRENIAYAAERGLPIDEAYIYVDPHFSAWKDSGGKRPEWQRLMGAASRGELAGVIIWKLDRFTRAPRDMEDLIELAELHGLVIDGPHSGRIDLSTAIGRQQARGAATQAAAESDNTSERVKAGLWDAMEQGEPQGAGRAFGFAGSHGEARSVVREDEAQIVREVAGRVVLGAPLAVLAAELNERGIATARGGQWTGANLGRLLGQARYGGLVECKSEIVGTMPGSPILDRETFEDLRAMLSSRRRGARPTQQFELTGVIVCDRCEITMNGATGGAKDRRVRQYRCPRNRAGCGQAIHAARLEEIVGAHMVTLLADPKNRKAIRAEDESASVARADQIRKLQAIEAQLVSLEVKLATGEIIQAAYDASKPVLDRRLATARASLSGLDAPAVRPSIAAGLQWDKATAAERRALVQRFHVTIRITPPTERRWQPDRIVIS